MATALAGNFEVNAGLPLDHKIVKADIAARDAIPAVQRYIGMFVTVQDTNITYKLSAPLTNSDWSIFGIHGAGSAESIAFWIDANTLGSNIFFTRANATSIVYNNQGFTADININCERWVSTTGSDSNSGMASGVSDWLTLGHAMQRCPRVGSGRYLVHLANGTYSATSFKVPTYLSWFELGDGVESIIHIQGNTSSPSSVVLENLLGTLCTHEAAGVHLIFEGITFKGDETNALSRGVNQNTGKITFINCNIEDFILFHAINLKNSVTNYTGTINIDNVVRVVSNSFSHVNLEANITYTTPSPSIGGPALVSSFVGDVTLGNNLTITMTCPAFAAEGYLFEQNGGFLNLGSGNTLRINDGDALFTADGAAIVIASENNFYYVNTGNAIFRLNGSAQFYDAVGNWRSNSSATFVIPLSTSAKFYSPNYAEAGVPPGPYLILNDLVTYVQYQSSPNYYASSDDDRYVDVKTVTMLGELNQDTASTGLLIGAQGVSSAEQIIKTVERNEQLVGMRITSDVGNGIGNTDTYFVYINGVASGLSVGLTNTNNGSATASTLIPLVAGDRISFRCNSAAATTAENITMSVLTRKRL